jgi:hypothetical protein
MATALLDRALLVNPYVPDYLLGWVPLSEDLPDVIASGQESEAIEYVMSAEQIWLNTPGALDWLTETSAIL